MYEGWWKYYISLTARLAYVPENGGDTLFAWGRACDHLSAQRSKEPKRSPFTYGDGLFYPPCMRFRTPNNASDQSGLRSLAISNSRFLTKTAFVN